MPNSPTPLGFEGFIQQLQSNPIALSIFALLLLMSILSWYIILSKTLKLLWLRWHSQRYRRRFWQHNTLQTAPNYLAQHRSRNSFARLCAAGLHAHLQYQQARPEYITDKCSHSDYITRSLQHSLDQERHRLQSGLSLLASISSTAPFIGLLGTVLGIYHALLNIGAHGQASLSTVAGPVGEALIMTALGLAVAIPAVLGYNFLNKVHRHFLHQLQSIAHELYSFLHLGLVPVQNPADIKEYQQAHSELWQT